MAAEEWVGAREIFCRTTGLLWWFCEAREPVAPSGKPSSPSESSEKDRAEMSPLTHMLHAVFSASLFEWMSATGVSLALLYIIVLYMKSRGRSAEDHSTSLAAGDGVFLSRSTTDNASASDKSDHGIPGPGTLDRQTDPDLPGLISDVQQFLSKFTCAYGVTDIVRSLRAQCLPLSDTCLKLMVDDADESLRWLWLIPVPSANEAALILQDIRLVEQTNAFAKTGSDNYCTAFRTSEWVWYVKEKGAQQGDGSSARNIVVLLEKHFVEYPIDLGNLATLGVDRLTAILRQISLAFEVFQKFENLPAVEALKWKLTLGVHEDDLIEFWYNQELHIAPSHGVQARLSPTSIFGSSGVDLGRFLESTITQVPALRCNPDLRALSRLVTCRMSA